MIQIGSSKAKLLLDKFDNKTYDGITFKLEGGLSGLNFKVSVDGDENTAKSIIKKVVTEMPECKTAYLKVDLLDEKGRII